jgi:transaldolase
MDEEILYQSLTIQDAQIATDILESVYFSSGGKDGLVSLEVSPHFAIDTQVTFETARCL